MKQEADWMIYLADVLRGQLDPVFSFKDEHKSKQDFKIKYNMYRYWNAVSVGYAEYHSIVMRTITLHHTIHAGALETYSKSNNIKTNVNRTLIGNRCHNLCTDVPPPSGKVGRGDVCESPLLIVHKLYFCSFADGWKGTCRSKNSSGVCAQASRTSSRNVHPKIQIQDLWLQASQVKRFSQDRINVFIIRKLNRW